MKISVAVMKVILAGLLAVLVTMSVAADESLESALVGSWRMEDVYTLQNPDNAGLYVESHPRGAFVYAVTIRRDGTGTLDGTPFSWSVEQDRMTWRFRNGGSVNTLTRFLDDDHFLILSLLPGGSGPIGSISSLRRDG